MLYSQTFIKTRRTIIAIMRTLLFVTIVLGAILGAYGRGIEDRIVGGSDAPDGKYPYQVSLRRTSHLCGGSILNKRWILTAAHCIVGQSAQDIKVVAGTNLLNGTGQTYQADLILPHPDYEGLLIINDIGLIRVSKDIVFNENVQSIKLPESDAAKENDTVILSGWGSTKLGGPLPNRLQHINLKVVSQESCKRVHSPILESHICTLTKTGEGACHGDSGSPLVAGDTQIGIVSYGRPCARGYPDVFTRVWTFVEWINKFIKQNN